jgi:hypothetical protein
MVGSGLMQRAVAIVINARVKTCCMRWKWANATFFLAVRVAFLNAEWEAAV